MIFHAPQLPALLSLLLTFPLFDLSAALGAPPPVPPPMTALPLPPAVNGQPATDGSLLFEQILHHDDPSQGTFAQRVWWNAEFWGGPGSPIVFFTPGETDAQHYGGYLTNRTLTGRLAQELKGAVVMVEHRYYGKSSPYLDLTTKNLQYLTLENSISDFVYLANNIRLPFDATNSSNAKAAPWIFSGGSYAGSLAAWTESTQPGTFWAYHASSAPVQAISDYWQYFVPVEQGMPKNCSRDVSRVVTYIDKTLKRGSPREQYALKQRFGLEKLQHDDFGAVLEYGLWAWQSNTFTTGYSSFYNFCDTIEAAQSSVVRGEDGVGLEVGIERYSTWVRLQLLPELCQAYGYEDRLSIECLDTHNATNNIFTDRSVGNVVYRQWQWMLCNEPFGWWQDAAPHGTKSLISRFVTAAYWERQCALFFPPEGNYTYGIARGLRQEQFNARTGGWKSRPSVRLIYTNGQFDPWRTAGVSSEFRPGGPMQSTEQQPVQIIPGGFHCSDLILSNADANEGVRKVVEREIEVLKGWVAEWHVGKTRRDARSGSHDIDEES